MSKGSCDKMQTCGMLSRPEETESGSAGTQVRQGIFGPPIRQRAPQVSGGTRRQRPFPQAHWTSEPCLKNPTANLRGANDLRERYALSG